LVDSYRQIFTTGLGFTVWEVTRDVVETAAVLRAKHRLRMLDALHVASAVVHGAGFFITNDEGLRRVNEVHVLVLSDFLTKTP
jgi:predicted nucleic acid-binding protein